MKSSKSLLKYVALPLLACALCIAPARLGAEQPADGGGNPPPPPQDGGGPGGPPDGRPPGMPRRDGHDGPMGGPRGDRPGPPELGQLERMRNYLELVDRFSKMAQSSTTSGVAAVITAGDVLRQRGPDAAIDFYNKTLPQVKDPTVQRAIHLQLADLYKASGQQDKALAELTQLMTGAASDNPSPGAR